MLTCPNHDTALLAPLRDREENDNRRDAAEATREAGVDALTERLQSDAGAMAEAWDTHTGHELLGREVAQYLRDGNKDGLFNAVRSLVRLGVRKVAEDRYEDDDQRAARHMRAVLRGGP